MPIVDKYKQAFLEEARERLVELEAALLALNQTPEDPELVGSAFRALHTIKGSGAMFGFDDVAAFTHHIETAFDAVRNGHLAVSPHLVNLGLSALDHIKAMLDQASGQGTADPAIATQILATLRELTGKAAPSAPERASAVCASPVPAPTGAAREWHIRFQPGADMLRTGANPLLLLRELSHLGSLHSIAGTDAIPPLGELDPDRCYVSWDMVLTTVASADEIRDVFIFVEDSCELAIAPREEQRTTPETAGTAGTSAGTTPPGVPDPRGVAGTSPGRSATDNADNAAAKVSAKPWGRRASDTPDNASSIRVPAPKLDQLVNLVGELVTVQARLGEIAATREDPIVVLVSEEVERLTAALRENSMSIRMLPIRATFERFRRLVHDLARDLHKEVELTTEGADTELDKTVIDQLGDPLMHLIRNSMDHGIETSEARRAAGKNPTADIHLSARHSGAQVLISVADDGQGIDREAVRARAVEKGLIAAEAQLAESEIFSLILAPGFSTAKQITDVSGRGVGMDVVRRNVEALRGSIEITSKPGGGTAVTLRLPLTLAIIDGLLVRVGPTRFILPLANTVECVELTRQDVHNANGKHLAYIRGEVVPYIRLSEYLEIESPRQEREQVMIAETEQGRFGFVVDEVLGDHQTVIKNLGRLYRNVQCVSGATILGDGTVALILDLHRLAQDVIRTAGLNANQRHDKDRDAPPGKDRKREQEEDKRAPLGASSPQVVA
jgi:two-component system, chemotaxis family, sensor kinase CheA